MHLYKVKDKKFNRYEVVKTDKVQCKLELKDIGPIVSDDPSLEDSVCVTKKVFSQLQAKAISDCKNAQAIVVP